MKCPKCREYLGAHYVYCCYCGENLIGKTLIDEIVCPNCEEGIDKHYIGKGCPYCHGKIDKAGEPKKVPVKQTLQKKIDIVKPNKMEQYVLFDNLFGKEE